MLPYVLQELKKTIIHAPTICLGNLIINQNVPYLIIMVIKLVPLSIINFENGGLSSNLIIALDCFVDY